MPTPFYHLFVAEKLLESPEFQPEISLTIKKHQNVFLLGNVAPDVQVISGQTRESTHFYKIPCRKEAQPPWEQLLSDYPALKHGNDNDLEQAVFIAGYMCHLQADWLWVRQIFQPFFGPGLYWKSTKERLYLHNILRAYFDYKVFEKIKSETRSSFSQAAAKAWVPFFEVTSLSDWQNFLINQLKPGAPIKTVEVFASRQGISPENYYRLLETEDEMKIQIFNYLPRDLLKIYLRTLMEDNIALINRHLTTVGVENYANAQFFRN